MKLTAVWSAGTKTYIVVKDHTSKERRLFSDEGWEEMAVYSDGRLQYSASESLSVVQPVLRNHGFFRDEKHAL